MRAGGKRAEPPEAKAARGTVQRCRDGVDTGEALKARRADVDRAASPALQITPPVLPIDVADVWAEYIDAVIANGGRQCDAETFAEWCAMTSILRRARNGVVELGEGEAIAQSLPAPASYVQQWRQLGELLGLAGPKSRLMQKGGGADGAKAANPFSRNGPRARA